MSTNAHRELAVPLDTSYLANLRKEVLEVLRQALVSPSQANLIALAVDEAVANVLEHGYGCRPGGPTQDGDMVVVVLDLTPERLTVTIRDKGSNFNPSALPEVDIEEHARAGRKNGLGIFLIRRIMDEVNYALKENSENELQLVKYIDEGSAKAKSSSLGPQ